MGFELYVFWNLGTHTETEIFSCETEKEAEDLGERLMIVFEDVSDYEVRRKV